MPRTIPDFTSGSDPANIRRILDYLDRLPDVPGPAIDALRGLLAQVERRDAPATQEGDKRTVVIPAHERAEHSRAVPLVDVTFACRMCGKVQTITTYPGRKPELCPGDIDEDGKRIPSKCQRDRQLERMRELRRKQRGG